jgi:hypothetical protein
LPPPLKIYQQKDQGVGKCDDFIKIVGILRKNQAENNRCKSEETDWQATTIQAIETENEWFY